ncbi:hypothetical protein CFLV_09105 [Corynebacterium flavescens]|uniref:Uncharacterized protein n=1 Tax=Corynebacterium flavescens TaxID=28028 RepID=A0A1L7CNC6_CORFL|nr:hypothetical protein CFLV_09105 [Corynebacterium flavescens]
MHVVIEELGVLGHFRHSFAVPQPPLHAVIALDVLWRRRGAGAKVTDVIDWALPFGVGIIEGPVLAIGRKPRLFGSLAVPGLGGQK